MRIRPRFMKLVKMLSKSSVFSEWNFGAYGYRLGVQSDPSTI